MLQAFLQHGTSIPWRHGDEKSAGVGRSIGFPRRTVMGPAFGIKGLLCYIGFTMCTICRSFGGLRSGLEWAKGRPACFHMLLASANFLRREWQGDIAMSTTDQYFDKELGVVQSCPSRAVGLFCLGVLVTSKPCSSFAGVVRKSR